MSGLFITFEGPEGAGKTTQARLLADRLAAAGIQVLLTREPGGTELGNRIRDLVLPASGLPISARAETLLYCVARAQLVEEVLRPALARGEVAIVDRYADSTLAYQAYGRDLDPTDVRAVLDFATNGLRPDLTLLLDLPVDIGLARKERQAAGTRQTGTASKSKRSPSINESARPIWIWRGSSLGAGTSWMPANRFTTLAETILATVTERLASG